MKSVRARGRESCKLSLAPISPVLSFSRPDHLPWVSEDAFYIKVPHKACKLVPLGFAQVSHRLFFFSLLLSCFFGALCPRFVAQFRLGRANKNLAPGKCPADIDTFWLLISPITNYYLHLCQLRWAHTRGGLKPSRRDQNGQFVPS